MTYAIPWILATCFLLSILGAIACCVVEYRESHRNRKIRIRGNL